jgi:hypothetical protein
MTAREQQLAELPGMSPAQPEEQRRYFGFN